MSSHPASRDALWHGCTLRVKPGRCHEQRQSTSFSFAASRHARNNATPISPTTRGISFFSASICWAFPSSSSSRDGIFSLAAPPSALPEPHSISLRLHHCTSPTTITTTPPTRPVVHLPSCVPPTPGLSDSHTQQPSHHNVGDRSQGACQQRQELGARCPRWLR